MAMFSSRKRKTEDESDLPDTLEGDQEVAGAEVDDADVLEESGSRSRPLLLILGLVVILGGGGYLAWNLFMEAPPPPPAPRPMAGPAAKAPAPPAIPQAPVVPAPAAKAPMPAAPPQPARPEAKAPVAPSTPAPAKKVEAKGQAPALAKPEAKPVGPPVAKVEAKPAAPGKGAKVAEKPAPGPPSKAEAKAERKPGGPSTWSVQVGALAMQENADSLKRRLDERGYPASIRKGLAYLSKHVVTVGEFGGRREAEELSRRLTVDGFPSQLLAAEDKYAPQVASFSNLDEAIDLARELQKKNYRPKISSKQANTTVYQVRHGTFDSRASAEKRGEELRAKGFNVWIVRD